MELMVGASMGMSTPKLLEDRRAFAVGVEMSAKMRNSADVNEDLWKKWPNMRQRFELRDQGRYRNR
jgi:hypothetical protein